MGVKTFVKFSCRRGLWLSGLVACVFVVGCASQYRSKDPQQDSERTMTGMVDHTDLNGRILRMIGLP